MMANLRVRACMVLLLAGFVPAAHASITLELRSVGAPGFQLAQGDDTISVQMPAPGLLHVHYMPMGDQTPPSLVMDPQPASAAVFKPGISKQGDAVTLRSPRMVVTWDTRAGTLTVDDPRGHVLLRQSDLATLAHGRIELQHEAGDALYGIGGFEANQPVTAGLLRSGKWVAQAGKQGHAGAPFVWSTKGYGVLVDCDGADFDLAGGRITIDKFKRPDADYYILVGTPEELFGELAKLSGPAPLFPKWAMGFTNSQWGIDQKELLDIVKTYRAKQIPIDNFTLDFDWKAWGEDNYGEFRWNPAKFPDGPGGKPISLMESGAILIYLAEKTGRFLNQENKYVVLQWLMFQMGGVGPMFGQVGFFNKFAGKDYEDKRPRDRYVNESKRLLGVMESHLEERQWFMGNEYTIADVSMLGWVRNLIGFYGARELVAFDSLKHVPAWLDRGLARPAVQRGLQIPKRD